MSILFFSTASLFDGRFLILLDEAAIRLHGGERVTFVYCDGCLRHCRTNVSGSKMVCRVCRFLTKRGLDTLPQGCAVHPLGKFLTAADAKEIDALQFDYDTAEKLREVEFRGVDIGYSVLSHYIGMKRNLTPILTPALKRVLNNHLKAAARVTAATERMLSQCPSDVYALFNGRMFDTRGFIRKAVEIGNGTCLSYEVKFDATTQEKRKIFFTNALPHNITENARIFNMHWEEALGKSSLSELTNVGGAYFERRRSGQKTDDPNVYTTRQVKGALPESWSERERNFVFFNSSEDEFASIDKEYDQYKYLPTQCDVIRRVAKLAKEVDPTIRIYLRIHPNLASVDFDYHHEFMHLDKEFDNITVVPASSPISTYALIDNAEKVLVSGSTVGIEAVYAGRPVILLGPAIYRFLGGCYVPDDDTQLKVLLKDRLEPKDRLAALKYGYYMMGVKGERWRYYDFASGKKRVLGIMKVHFASCYTLLGSPVFFGVLYKFITSVLFIPYHLQRSRVRRLGIE